MKTKYLILTVIISALLTGGVSFLIDRWNTNSFEKSDLYRTYLQRERQLNYKMTDIQAKGGSTFSQDDIAENISGMKNLGSYYNNLYRQWVSDNQFAYRLKLLIPILAFLVFNIAILNQKYSGKFKTVEMMKSAYKNLYYSICSVVCFILLILNVFLS